MQEYEYERNISVFGQVGFNSFDAVIPAIL